MEGDSACGLKAGRWEGRVVLGASVPSGRMGAARAEKNPAPLGGGRGASSLENVRRAGETGAEGGPLRDGWLRTREGWFKGRLVGGAWGCWAGRGGFVSAGGRMLAPLADLVSPLGVWGCGGGAFCGFPRGAAIGCWGCGGLFRFGGLPFMPELAFRAPLKWRDASGCGGSTTSSGWASESATLKSASSKSKFMLEHHLAMDTLIAYLQIRRQMCLQMLGPPVSQTPSQITDRTY